MTKITGNIVDVVKNKIYPGEVIISEDKISEIKEVAGDFRNFILPGLVDAHIHIESSMLAPSSFAEVIVPHGTVATVSDPHEIANVLGIAGVNYMILDTQQVPLKIFYTAPSCVPATPFETAGANLGAKEIREILQKPEIVALGEMMNFPGVVSEVPEVIEKIKAAKELGKPIDGHCPGLSGEDLKKYVSFGITTEHEATAVAEAQEKIKAGMKIMIRLGSSANQLKDLIEIVRQGYQDGFFVSDDKHPDDLKRGHLNLILKRAVELGVDPIVAIKMVSLNPVKHYHLPVGLLQINDPADLVVVNNLKDFQVFKTYINGQLVAENGKALFKVKPQEIGSSFSIDKKTANDFIIKSEKPVKVRVIKATEGQIITGQIIAELKPASNDLNNDLNQDILKIAVCSRYGNNNVGLGFISGFGLKRGAIASSVAHDSHNIVVVGTNNQAMAKAVNAVAEIKGGLVAVDDKEIIKLELPIAGLMSLEKVDMVIENLKRLHRRAKDLGCQLLSPFMTMSFMALLVIPKLKLSDKGLFDGNKFEFVEVILK